MPPIGVSFLESDEERRRKTPNLGGAVQILGLTLPQVLGSQAIAPRNLLTAPGGAGPQGLAPTSVVGRGPTETLRPTSLADLVAQTVIQQILREGEVGVGTDIATQLTPPTPPSLAAPTPPSLPSVAPTVAPLPAPSPGVVPSPISAPTAAPEPFVPLPAPQPESTLPPPPEPEPQKRKRREKKERGGEAPAPRIGFDPNALKNQLFRRIV